MTNANLTAADYPLAERRPELVRGTRGKALEDLTIDALTSGDAGMEDLRITPNALRQQAAIARSAGREALARNFERAAEMADIPQDDIMALYELLRPGRVAEKQVLLDAAARLRNTFNAPLAAAFFEEAADVYERRGLFKFRY